MEVSTGLKWLYSPVLSPQTSLSMSLSFTFPSYKTKIAQRCAPNTVWRAWQLPSTHQQSLSLALSLFSLNSQACINCFTLTREIRNKKQTQMCDSLTSEFAVQYFRAPKTKIYNLEKAELWIWYTIWRNLTLRAYKGFSCSSKMTQKTGTEQRWIRNEAFSCLLNHLNLPEPLDDIFS